MPWKTVVLLLISIVCTSEALKAIGPKVCKVSENRIPEKDCQYLVGNFEFMEDECPQDKYAEVEQLDGTLHFHTMKKNRDPMACFPNLKSIYVQDDYWSSPAIKINKSVEGMEAFTFNPELVIYTRDPIWIKIEAHDYNMDSKTYRAVVSRFGKTHVKIPAFSRDRECKIKDLLMFFNQLDNCDIVSGTLTINNKLLTTDTKTTMHKLDGCIRINGTERLELKHLEFLRKLKRVNCPELPIIRGNQKLCMTELFLNTLIKAHTNLNLSPQDLETWKSETKLHNGYKHCDTVCFADDLHDETKDCRRVVGDLVLREEYLPKLQNLTVIRGRLIIDGFGKEEIFDHLPNLQIIRPYDQGPYGTSYTALSSLAEPAVLVRRNRVLKYFDIPDYLRIISAAKPLIAIYSNYFYRMTYKDYKELRKKYSKEQLSIEYLRKNHCYFPTPITNITQLDKCEIVFGDLVIEGDVGLHNETSASIRIVTGCIRINGTNLEDLHFLLRLDGTSGIDCFGGHALTNNKRLCAKVWYPILGRTNAGTGNRRTVVANNREFCSSECNRDMLYSGPNCITVNEGFGMPLGIMDEFIPSIMSMEEIHGPLQIKYTNLKEITMFTSLKKIVVTTDSPAIEIVDNEHLKYLNFSKLENITMQNDTVKWIKIRNNGLYRMPLEQYKRLCKYYGEEHLDIDHYEEDRSYEVGIYVGSGFAVATGLLVCVAVLSWRLHVTSRKKFEKEEKKPLLDDKGKGKHEDPEVASTDLNNNEGKTGDETLPSKMGGKNKAGSKDDPGTIQDGPKDDYEVVTPDDNYEAVNTKVSVAGAVTARTAFPEKARNKTKMVSVNTNFGNTSKMSNGTPDVSKFKAVTAKTASIEKSASAENIGIKTKTLQSPFTARTGKK